MELFWAIVLFIVGGVVVIKGADFFVDAASWMSDVLAISKVIMGATVIAAATSGPELFVSLFAALEGKVDMSIGNVVGSDICNLGIGLALIACFRPAKNNDKFFGISGAFMIGSAVLLFLCSLTGTVDILFGAIFFVVYVAFTILSIRHNQKSAIETSSALNTQSLEGCPQNTDQQTQSVKADKKPQKTRPAKKPTNAKEITINIIKFVGGLAGIIIGSKLIVDNATILAKAMGVSEMFIGLTIVAIGTSLPEIVTTIVAIVKKEDDLGIGNLIGSNVFNTTFIIAIAAFASGGNLAISPSVFVDLPVALVLMLIAVIPTVIGKKIYRWQGDVLAVVYVGYIAYLGVTG